MSFARNRVIFNTSTLIGALLFPHSNHAQTFVSIVAKYQPVALAETLQELVEVVGRPKFDRYRAITERAEFVKRYSDIVELISVAETVNDCRDVKDNKFLALALAAGATAIISSDDDLLVLHPYRGIEVVEMAAFATRHLST